MSDKDATHRAVLTNHKPPVDQLERFNSFATKVVDAMNENGVEPPIFGMGAVMPIVFLGPESEEAPMGGSINYENGRWELSVDVTEAEPCPENEATT